MVGYQTLRDASCYEMGTRSRAGVLTPRQSGLLGTSARCHPRGRSRRFGFQPRSLRGTSTPCPWARAHQIALSWGGPSRQDGSWARGGRRAALCWMRLSARTQRDGQGALTRRTRRTLLSWGSWSWSCRKVWARAAGRTMRIGSRYGRLRDDGGGLGQLCAFW